MKKQLSAILATALLLTSSAEAIFPDIPDPTVQQAVTALYSLGIVNGMGNGLYDPTRVLSRAEFTKMSATTMGLPIQSATFSVFADVPYSHWAAPYVNATVGAETPVITGYADGTFRPSAPVSYGEACTMLLRMLGYGVADIGANWPTDYINRAQQLGLTGNLRLSATTPVDRGTAAILLRNTLSAEGKEGGKLLDNLTGASALSDAILVATGQTDPSLSPSQVSFYVGGEIQTLYTVSGLDTSLIGTQGTVLFDKTNPALVRGFLPAGGLSQSRMLTNVSPEGLTTTSGFVYVPRNTPTLVLGEVLPYDSCWFDLPIGTTVALQFTPTGDLQMIIATPGVGDVGGNDWVSGPIPTTPSTAPASLSVTGIYRDAEPSFRYPKTVTVLGETYTIPDAVAGQFVNLEEKDEITLLFDAYNRVSGVTTDRNAKEDMIGVVTSSSTSDVTVVLYNGLTVSGNLDVEDEDDDAPDIGAVVQVRESKDGISLSYGKSETKKAEDWQVLQNTMGKYTVSPKVLVFDTADDHRRLTLLPRSLYPTGTVKKRDILTAYCDANDVIVALVLDDYTGAGWVYGLAEDATDYDAPLNPEEAFLQDADGKPQLDVNGDPIPNPDWVPVYDYRLCFTTLDADGQTQAVIQVRDKPRDGLYGIPTTVFAQPNQQVRLDTQSLHRLDKVKLSDFDGYDRVRVDGDWLTLAEDVPVYREKDDSFMTLRQAKSNYDKFTVYADSKSNGIVRLLVLE